MVRSSTALVAAGIWLLAQTTAQAATVLFSETFDSVFGSATCSTGHGHGSGDHCARTRQRYGVPTTATGADQGWWGARFEAPDNGSVATDVGVAGDSSNAYALVEDDAGLLLRIDTRGYTDITLAFDWRTYSAFSNDRFVTGYYVGDLAGDAGGFDYGRSIDLRGNSAGWSWNAPDSGWNELLRARDNSSWNSENFSLSLAGNQGDVWIAFWLDNGENDYGKFDNVVVSGTSAVPLPAAAWLFASGLAGLSLAGRRRTNSRA